MHKLTITGASDDLIELDGDLRDELNGYKFGEDDEPMLGISDGTLLRVAYDDDGIWRFTPVMIGDGTQLSKVDGVVSDDTNDVVTLTSENPFKWAVLTRFGTAK